MTPETLAALHARCFDISPRPWSTSEFAALLTSPRCFLLSGPQGFLLGRVIVDEAELLTLAVAPEARKQGLGRRLVDDFAAASRQRHAATAFLEVAADNTPARALYAALGWRKAGRRPNYYRPGLDALILRLDLRDRQEGS